MTTNIPNLSYWSQLTSVYTSAELQNLFNLSRITTNFPTLPQLPQFPQLPPMFSAPHFPRAELFKPWSHLRNSVRNMHRRLNDIVECSATHFQFKEYITVDNTECVRIYFLLNSFIYYCDIPIVIPSRSSMIRLSSVNNTSLPPPDHRVNGKNSNFDNDQLGRDINPTPSTSSGASGGGPHRRHRNFSTYHGRAAYEMLSTQPTQPNMLIRESCQIRRFEYDQRKSRFLFSSGIHLCYFDDHPERDRGPHTPNKIDTRLNASKLDFRMCPSNPDMIAFCCAGDIWCVNVKNFQEVRLTSISNTELEQTDVPTKVNGINGRSDISDRNPFSLSFIEDDLSSDSAPLLVGRPSHVIREEFRRDQGFWWCPDNEYQVLNDLEDFIEHQLLYEETDQSAVEMVRINSWDGTVEEHRFPKAGGQNPISKLKVVKFKLSKCNTISDITTIELPDLKSIYPQCEYLVRAGWLGQKTIWVQMLNRRQTHLAIALISTIDAFEPQIIFDERNDVYWVSSHDVLYFLNSSKVDSLSLSTGSEVSFIWSSEETGYRHLYLVTTRVRSSANGNYELTTKRQLTDGQWEVSEKDFWVDEDEKLIYFCGLRDTPLENHLYVISYADAITGNLLRSPSPNTKIKIHRLSEPNYTHTSVAFNPGCSIFVNIQSNISTPPFGFVNLIVHHNKSQKKDHRRLPDSRKLSSLLINTFNYPLFETSHLENLRSIGAKPSLMYEGQTDLLPGLSKPELFCCQLTSGELIYGSVFKPEFMESSVRYPTVLEIYGGPETQLVSNNFMSLRQPMRHLLSSEGYVIVLIDCRGSGRRGLSFEAHTHHRMGQVEIIDQIEVLKWLAKNTGYIDLNRVAISGWSYGGYLSLMALAQYPKVFKVAIAGAPVTSWHMYDTAYTERFMGLPNENAEGYFKGSVLNYVHLFPDE